MAGIEHCNWSILLLLLTALTISFLLNCTTGRNEVISRIGNYVYQLRDFVGCRDIRQIIKDNLVREKIVSLRLVCQMTISSYRRNIKASLPFCFYLFYSILVQRVYQCLLLLPSRCQRLFGRHLPQFAIRQTAGLFVLKKTIKPARNCGKRAKFGHVEEIWVTLQGNTGPPAFA